MDDQADPKALPANHATISGSQGVQFGDHNVQFNLLFGGKQPSGQVVAGNVPQAPPAFQPRDDLTAQLRAVGPGVLALTGMRGVGKTQLAAAYARERRRLGWRLIAWVNAESGTSTLDDLAVVADRLGINRVGKTVEALGLEVRNRLEADGDECLIVFDNVTDPDVVRDYIPSMGSPQVLITSTESSVMALGKPLQVAVFTEEEALALLAARVGREDADGALALAGELGFLPLALSQAAAVIAAQHLTYGVYLDRLHAYPTRKYLPKAKGEPYPRGIAEAILLSVDEVIATDPTGLCGPLLGIVSFLSPDGVSRDLLYRGEPAGIWTVGAEAVDEALGRLSDASLVVFNGDASAVTAHRLVTRVIRERTFRVEAFTSLSTKIIGMLLAVAQLVGDPWEQPDRARELIRHVTSLNSYLASQPGAGDAAQLLDLRGWTLWCVAELAESPGRAVAIGEKLVADCERVLGRMHKLTLVTRTNLASAYRYAGQLDEAISLYERAYSELNSALGGLHNETLTARNNLALAYQDAGRLAEAIPIHEQEAAESEWVLEELHPHTLRSKNNLALAYNAAGRSDEAITLYERVLGDCERVLGRTHPETLVSVSNLAMAYETTGRLDDALPLLERAFSDSERVQGKEHQDTLTYCYNLALAYKKTGRIGDAIPLLGRAVAGLERVLGDDHPRTLTARSNLAEVYRSAGWLADAVPLNERTLADCVRVFGDHHPNTLATRSNLASAYRAVGRAGEAIPLFEASLAGLERVLGAEHPDTVTVRRNLARARREAQA